MEFADKFFKAIGVKNNTRSELHKFSKATNISISKLKYYNDNNIIPTGTELESICKISGLTETLLYLKMGIFPPELTDLIIENSNEINSIINNKTIVSSNERKKPNISFETKLGKLYKCDCIDLMANIKSNSVDVIFADPPFNLNKLYPSKINDNLKTEKYLHWCEKWLTECVRILKDGGSFFIWNMPKWNKSLAHILDSRLTFKHWIAADIKYGLPISNRLYPSHYSLLYYTKGETANVFHPDRLPMLVCNSCYGDIKDYGGYKDKMNPKGINLTDIWYDIPPVRHAKYKKRSGANELSVKLLDRIIEMSSNEGDIIFDPFGGAGTTYIVAEVKKRKWIGCEIGPINDIISRFENLIEDKKSIANYRKDLNQLFPIKIKEERKKRQLWTDESFK